MTPEEHSLLKKTYGLVEENNKMLHSMRRMNRISTLFRVFYWVVIIGASVGAYYLIQPYVESGLSLYKSAQSAIQEQMTTVQNISNTVNGAKNLIK